MNFQSICFFGRQHRHYFRCSGFVPDILLSCTTVVPGVFQLWHFEVGVFANKNSDIIDDQDNIRHAIRGLNRYLARQEYN
jgi:hypothetical protein